jgi:FtsP/CotA-like multicopper oxidase with cupredoxin domain
MGRREVRILMRLLMIAIVLSLGIGQSWAQSANSKKEPKYRGGKVTAAERKAAATRVEALGLQSGITSFIDYPGINQGPGGIPHYFGPYANWAYSPLPSFGLMSSVTIDSGGSGYNNPIVTFRDVYGTGTATATATIDVSGAITAIAVDTGSSGFHVPFVDIVDDTTKCGGASQPLCGTGAAATATLDLTTLAGGMRKFVDKLPGLGPANANLLVTSNRLGSGSVTTDGQYIPVGVAETRTFSGQAADYYEIALVEFYEKMHSDLQPTRQRGYVQLATATNKGKSIALTYLDGSPIYYPGTSNPVIAFDYPHFLGPVIVAKGSAVNAADPPVPVRIKFYNLLPTGSGGDLFLPVDETVPGSGVGSAPPAKFTQNRATIHLHGNNTVWISDGNTHQWITPANESTPYPKGASARNVPDMGNDCDAPGSGCQTFYYTNDQSARLEFYHDHAMGITRLNVLAGEAAGYVLTDKVDQDMINGTNSSGVNIAPGTTTPYKKVLPDVGIPLVIQDRTFVEAATIFAQDPTWNWGTGLRDGNGNITAAVDGDYWYPHVYMSAQNPWDLAGTNAFGRWHYGPWFNPPVPTCVNGGPVGCLEVGPVPNEYYQVQCDFPDPGINGAAGAVTLGTAGSITAIAVSSGGTGYIAPVVTITDPTGTGASATAIVANGAITGFTINNGGTGYTNPVVSINTCAAPWEPPLRPGTPNPSIAGEAFLDTPIVNGTAYPYMEVEPKAYRFRILNAANDRMFNLQLYVAADKTTPTTPGTTGTVLCDPTPSDPTVCTEVKMVPVSMLPANQYADWPSGVPDPSTKGPAWWQIGTEGGFMPAPLVVPQQPIGWNQNPTTFNYGNVNQHSLLLGSAERADVVVDFSAYAGKTLILYNDAPAAFPAGVPVYDYFTGVADQTDVGGAPTTQPGYGPNTRTIMQIRVAANATAPLTPDVTLANLQAVFAKTNSKRGVFEVSQEPIIIPQAAYNSAYNNTFPATAAGQYLQVADTQKTFKPIAYNGTTGAWDLQPAVTIPLEMKAMHDEMSGVYDTQFGRMSGMLGLSLPTSPVHVLIPYGYSSPPTDLVSLADPVQVLPNGTQIWRIFHNGVDSHTIHTHLFHTQLVNRIAQDGIQLGVDPSELGWKDTFRVNPLEITYLAMRPTVPTPDQVPFAVPNSVRLIDPTLPLGAPLPPPPPAGWFDPAGNAITGILNHPVNFGWEYVWHCHILAHEEMDMMHSLTYAVPPATPLNLSAVLTGSGNKKQANLTWTSAVRATNYTVQRSTNSAFSTNLVTVPLGDVTTYTDPIGNTNQVYYYRVFASNIVGDTAVYAGSPLGFPTETSNSGFSNVAGVNLPTPPAAPTNLTATILSVTQVRLNWTDNANNETGFQIERSVNGAAFALYTTVGANVVIYTDGGVSLGNTYRYQVRAANAAGFSSYAGPVTVTVSAPAVPSNLTAAGARANGNNDTVSLTWTDNSNNETGFTIQRATNAAFTTGLVTSNVGANVTTFTTGNVSRATSYYFRIQATNAVGTSAWVNATPFPVVTP